MRIDMHTGLHQLPVDENWHRVVPPKIVGNNVLPEIEMGTAHLSVNYFCFAAALIG